MVGLRENEKKTLNALQKAGGRMTLEDVVDKKNIDHSGVMRAALSLREGKLIEILEKKRFKVSLNEEGKIYAEKGLPERQIVNNLLRKGKEASIKSIVRDLGLKKGGLTIALGWIIRKKWALLDKKNQKLKLTKKPTISNDEKLLKILKDNGNIFSEELDRELKETVNVLKRRNIIDIKEEIIRELELTEKGRQKVKRGIKSNKEISNLTSELIGTGKWREKNLIRYNIQAPVTRTWSGKKHPYLRFLDELKNQLVTLGFKEMSGPTVELSFYNCDSLYMPQDHPAREVHDMFLLKKLVQKAGIMHSLNK
jgi:phenylalanyl-tRNA synthetase alpha chain